MGKELLKYCTSSVKKLNADAEFGLKGGMFSVGGQASVVKYDAKYSFKAFGKTVSIGGSAAVGSIGAQASVGLRGFKGYLGVGAVGIGVSVDVKR